MNYDIVTVKKQLQEEHQVHASLREIRKSCITFMVLAAAVFIAFKFVLGTAVVSGSSMLPTVRDGEVTLFNRLVRDYDYGDIVIINDMDQYYIKRIIAKGGDEIDISLDGNVYVNQIELNEPYLFSNQTMMGDMEYPQTVPDNHIFVLGDNRDASKDSRNNEIGMVLKDKIKGKLIFSWKFY